MKRISRIVIVILLMLSAVTALVFMGVNGRLSGKDGSKGEISYIQMKGFGLSDEEFSLALGESYQCGAFLDGTKLSQGVQWFSSDTSVATVDGKGRVTAVSAGETEITAQFSENMTESVKVWVYDNVSQSAANAITALATDGSDESFMTLANLARQLKCAKSDAVTDYSDLLNTLLKFSEMGAGGTNSSSECWQKLTAALSDTEIKGIDENTLRRAALSAYCQGEKLVNDVTISFAGDCTFAYFNETNRANMFPSVYKKAGSVTYPLDLTRNVFGADDITMVNFEGTLTESKRHKDKTFYFRGEPSYVNILTNSSVEAVTVENNHSFDYLDTGYKETLSHLRDAGVRYTAYHSPAEINMNGCRVVMLSLDMVSSYYKPEFQNTIENYIKQYRNEKTIIIVNLHWGIESAGTPEAWQVAAAHSMIDAGADMIIGHHPHVLQGIELYNGHYIVYSLGNFSFGGNSAALRPQTIIFRASFKESGSGYTTSRVSIVPCYTTSSGSTVNNFRPTPVFGSKGSAVVTQLLTLSGNLKGGISEIYWNQIP